MHGSLVKRLQEKVKLLSDSRVAKKSLRVRRGAVKESGAVEVEAQEKVDLGVVGRVGAPVVIRNLKRSEELNGTQKVVVGMVEHNKRFSIHSCGLYF